MRAASGLLIAALWLPLFLAGHAGADEVEEEPTPEAGYEELADPIFEQLRTPEGEGPVEDLAPLWDHLDPVLQKQVDGALHELGLDEPIRRRKLGVVFVDITEVEKPRVASVNGDVMMYAASLPKIAVLLAVYESAAEGRLEIDKQIEEEVERMIRDSSNSAATDLMNRVGKEYIAQVLLKPRYRLYDPTRGGGLWVGKDYAKAGLWRRDPLHNLSHGATAMQVARFYYLLETENLVTPEYSREMKRVLGNTRLHHKFVRVLERINPAALLFRKSGTWRTHHSDSVLAERGDSGYIAVALSDSSQGTSGSPRSSRRWTTSSSRGAAGKPAVALGHGVEVHRRATASAEAGVQ
jgi:beta-lactamase class A